MVSSSTVRIGAVRLRKLIGLLFFLVLFIPCLTVLFFTKSTPSITIERSYQHRLAEIQERLRHAEMLNQERRQDVYYLKEQFSTAFELTTILRKKLLDGKSGSPYDSRNSSELQLANRLLRTSANEFTNQRRLANLTGFNSDLQLPTIFHTLPHLMGNHAALQPALKLSQGRVGVSLVMGIPTVYRSVQSYLTTTLQSLIDSMNEAERKDCLLVVFIAETDLNFVQSQTTELKKAFPQEFKSGLLEVISPPPAFYPDFSKLRKTLGDSEDRVKWRSKQNLDFAFLMMYCQTRGTFYVQLEDDVLTKPGFAATMKQYALQKTSEHKYWLILDFCQLGFIGKMFKSVDLPQLIQFFVIFYNDKPVDWLLDSFVQTKVCAFDKDAKHCRKEKDTLWLTHKPSLFQHIGTHSSLKGKVQKLKDKQFGKVKLFFPHKNPPARVMTNITAYKAHSLESAYNGKTFFWGLIPQVGDVVVFQFEPSLNLSSYMFRSGNVEHPNDRFYNTTVEVRLQPGAQPGIEIASNWTLTKDSYWIIGRFTSLGVAEGKLDTNFGLIKELRLRVQSESDNWAILSEINFVPVGQEMTKSIAAETTSKRGR